MLIYLRSRDQLVPICRRLGSEGSHAADSLQQPCACSIRDLQPGADSLLNAIIVTATPTRQWHQAPRSGHVPRRVSLPCRSAASPTNQPKWRHCGILKSKPKASRLAGRSGQCSRALKSSAGRVCFMDWCPTVENHRIQLPLLRWTEPAKCHHQVSIGLIQVGFSRPHESHFDSKARENPT